LALNLGGGLEWGRGEGGGCKEEKRGEDGELHSVLLCGGLRSGQNRTGTQAKGRFYIFGLVVPEINRENGMGRICRYGRERIVGYSKKRGNV
jgi:hypothetical protein